MSTKKSASEVKSVEFANDKGGMGEAPAAEDTPVRSETNHANLFVLFVTIGIMTIVTVPPEMWYLPVLVMAGYAVLGLRRAREQGVVVEFTDSFYYLGFSLTLVSLLKSTGVLGGELPAAATMVVDFGKGLTTTVCGVVGRVVFQLYYQVAQESIEESNRAIQELSRDYVRSLTKVNASVKENWKQAEDRVTDTAGKLAASMEEIERNLTSLKTKLASEEADIGGALASMKTRISAAGLTQEIHKVTRSFDSLRMALGEVQADSDAKPDLERGTPATVASAVGAASDSLSQMSSTSTKVNRSIGELGQNIQDLEKIVQEIAAALRQRF